jgi:tetratricopeptide (TPR) repeat protein
MGQRKPRESTAPTAASRDARARVRPAWPLGIASALLYASLLLLYAPSLSFGPISLDDASLLTHFAEQPLSSIWAYDHFAHLRPVKNLFFYSLSRDTDALPVFRALVLLCFIASTGLVQWLASRLLDHRGWGLAAAALWAWNPTLSSVNCWLAAANVAFCLLGLLTFSLFAWRALDRVDTPAGPGYNTPIALAGLLLAVLSHELALLAPALLLLNLPAMRNRRARLLGVGSAACIALLLGLRAVNTPPATSYRFDAHPAWLLVVSAARYLLENLRLWVWPWGRFGVLFVERPREHLLASALCWVVVIAAGVLVFRAARRDPALAAGAAWAAIFLVPVTNLFPLGNTPVALHYLYIPAVGLALIFARGLQRAGAWIARRDRPRRSWLPALVVGIAAVAWLPEQRRELHAWGDEELLYSETVRDDPTNVEARVNLVSTLINRDRYADAAKLIQDTLPLAPHDTALIRNAFETTIKLRPPAEALAFAAEHAAQLDQPVHDFARGELLEQLQRHAEARAAYERAFAAAPTAQARFAAGYRLAIALVRTQRSAEASRLIEQLLAEFPGRQELLLAKQLLAAPPMR